MPATEHDNDPEHNDATLDEHAHYVQPLDAIEHVTLDHGGPVQRLYQARGDWYAVHTH